MTRKRRLTDECFEAIPRLLAEGRTKRELAEMWGVKTSTLSVQCSRRRVSLRPPPKREPGVPRMHLHIRPAREVIDAFEKRARARGQTGAEFVSELLSIIARDDLFEAVLDEA